MYFFKKYAEVALYNAYSRAIAIDFSIGNFHFFDPRTIQFILNKQNQAIEDICINNESDRSLIESCIKQLIENKIVFITSNPEQFPEIGYNIDNFSLIENLHICFNESNENSNSLIVETIDLLKVKAVKLNFTECSEKYTHEILKLLSTTHLESIECVFDYVINKITETFLHNLLPINRAITVFSISNLPSGFRLKDDPTILLFDNDAVYPKFAPTFPLYSESQNYNTYFNRKLFIDSNGEIKNAPECIEVIEKLDTITSAIQLKTVIENVQNQKYWFVKKDNIDVCRDCEFRHVCVDNRVPIQRNENEWYHQTECNFNPYITKWKHDEGYKTLSNCGIQSDNFGFNLDHEKIERINYELWEQA